LKVSFSSYISTQGTGKPEIPERYNPSYRARENYSPLHPVSMTSSAWSSLSAYITYITAFAISSSTSNPPVPPSCARHPRLFHVPRGTRYRRREEATETQSSLHWCIQIGLLGLRCVFWPADHLSVIIIPEVEPRAFAPMPAAVSPAVEVDIPWVAGTGVTKSSSIPDSEVMRESAISSL